MLTRYIIILLIIYIVVKLLKKLSIKDVTASKGQRLASTGEDLVEDPFCHTYIPISEAYKTSSAGKDLYFCSKKCFEKYITHTKDQA